MSKTATTNTKKSLRAGSDPQDSQLTQASSSIGQKIADLDAAVEWFYSDDFNLDQALANYKSVTTLVGEIEQYLAELKNQVEVLEDFTKN